MVSDAPALDASPSSDGSGGDRGLADSNPADSGPALDSQAVDGPVDQSLPVDSGVTYTGAFPATLTTGFNAVTLVVGGVSRQLTVYVCAGGTPKRDLPLIIGFPGTSGIADSGIYDTQTFELCDAAVVEFIGIGMGGLVQNQGDWDQHIAGERYLVTYPNVDLTTNNDLQTVVAAITEAKRAYGVDPRRVYATGSSNGAFFAQFVAMSLPHLVAGFAATGGGLVRCANTADCAFRGSSLTCAGLAQEPGWCNCTGPEKPLTVPSLAGYKPAGYIDHSNNDDLVSIYHACQLADRMTALGYPMHFNMRTTGGHGAQNGFMIQAWAYLKNFARP